MVDLRGLHVWFGKLHAVRGIDLRIPRGEIFGFIGPNGAGKTTTIKVLATLIPEFVATRARVGGVPLAVDPQRVRMMIGYVPDEFGLYRGLTVRQYLEFFAAAYFLPARTRAAVIDDVLQLTDLTGKADSPVDGLSRGMKQRLSVARVLLHDPELLLLDEPASGLDPRARIEMRELLKALHQMGKTILISSHILHELSQLCTQIGVIEAGRMVASGPLSEIYRRLNMQRVVQVQITNLDDGMVQRIRTLPGVAGVQRMVDQLTLEVREDVTALEDLLDALRSVGARIRAFQPEQLDMETVFMRLTEGQVA
ncbi:MAG: ABC transporter ATP-binding protein [Planctomycetota bacterium]|nr:MAG: ABC transporter ATP-binding protein [Planctomycetota bacterium]